MRPEPEISAEVRDRRRRGRASANPPLSQRGKQDEMGETRGGAG